MPTTMSSPRRRSLLDLLLRRPPAVAPPEPEEWGWGKGWTLPLKRQAAEETLDLVELLETIRSREDVRASVIATQLAKARDAEAAAEHAAAVSAARRRDEASAAGLPVGQPSADVGHLPAAPAVEPDPGRPCPNDGVDRSAWEPLDHVRELLRADPNLGARALCGELRERLDDPGVTRYRAGQWKDEVVAEGRLRAVGPSR